MPVPSSCCVLQEAANCGQNHRAANPPTSEAALAKAAALVTATAPGAKTYLAKMSHGRSDTEQVQDERRSVWRLNR